MLTHRRLGCSSGRQRKAQARSNESAVRLGADIVHRLKYRVAGSLAVEASCAVAVRILERFRDLEESQFLSIGVFRVFWWIGHLPPNFLLWYLRQIKHTAGG